MYIKFNFNLKDGNKSISDVTVPSSFHLDNSQKKENENKKLIQKGRKKSHTDVKKKVETNTEIKKISLRKSNTFNSKSHNIFINEHHTIKEEDDKKYETILKKSKSLIFEKINTYKKFKAVLETIHEVSNSKIDSSELSDLKEDIHKDEANNNG